MERLVLIFTIWGDLKGKFRYNLSIFWLRVGINNVGALFMFGFFVVAYLITSLIAPKNFDDEVLSF